MALSEILVKPSTASNAVPTVTDEIDDAHWPFVKLAFGALGFATVVSDADPLPVAVSGSVSATISGTPAVTIANTPAVTIGATVTTREVQTSSAPAVANQTVTDVGAVEIFAANADRIEAVGYNAGPNTLYVGNAGVTAAAGFPVPSGSSFRERVTKAALYAISDGTSDLRKWET